jgi:anti-anti-sigma regulatory factor
MNITKENGTLFIDLPSECTIVKTEEHIKMLRSFFMPAELKKVELNAEAVEEIDTAYFQMLLSLKATAEHHKIPLSVSGMSHEVQKTEELYGLRF